MTSACYSLPIRPTILCSEELKALPRAFEKTLGSIVVVGTPTPDDQLFRFRLSLVIGPQGGSCLGIIRLDMRPSYTDFSHLTRGVVYAEYLSTGISDPSENTPFVIPIRNGVTAGDVCKYLFDYLGMDKYDFTPEGNGCRHWCATALENLATGGFVDFTVGGMFEEYETQEATKWGAKFPMPRITGMFYTLN